MLANLRLHISKVVGYLLEIERTLGSDSETRQLFGVVLSFRNVKQSFAGNTACVQTFAAKVFRILFDKQSFEAEFGSGDRNVESSRARSDDDQVVVHSCHASGS